MNYKEITIKKNNYTVTVYQPILDERERAKRVEHLKNVATAVFRDYLLRKEGKRNDNYSN